VRRFLLRPQIALLSAGRAEAAYAAFSEIQVLLPH
jgi:hypothetical protein